jgi:PAS domain S-box-containing protein
MDADRPAPQTQADGRRVAAPPARADEWPARPPEPLPDAFPELLNELRTSLEELKVAEEELRQQNEELAAARETVEAEQRRYQDLFEFAPDGYLVTDAHWTIREANHAAATMLRTPQQFLVGKPLVSFVALEERRAFRCELNRLCRAELIQEWVVRLRRHRGPPFDAALTVATSRDWEGKPVAFRWLLRDITERQRAEARQQCLERVLEHEREVVRLLTTSLLGTIPQIPGLQLAAIYQPASGSDQVGGDYFDFLPLNHRRIGVIIGDVCGHGLTALLHIAAVKYMLRAYAREDAEPQTVLHRLNRALCDEMSEEANFVSLVYGVLDLESATFTYANAGHPPSVLYDPASQRCCHLERTGVIAGAFPDLEYQQRTVSLEPGVVLALFTDGVTEAGGLGDLSGDESVRATLEEHGAENAQSIATAILERVHDQVGGPLRDDMAIVVVRST